MSENKEVQTKFYLPKEVLLLLLIIALTVSGCTVVEADRFNCRDISAIAQELAQQGFVPGTEVKIIDWDEVAKNNSAKNAHLADAELVGPVVFLGIEPLDVHGANNGRPIIRTNEDKTITTGCKDAPYRTVVKATIKYPGGYVETVTLYVNTTDLEVAYLHYIIRPGDTLWNIAEEHGVSVDELVKINHIENPDQIRAGDQLLIPQRVELETSPSLPESLFRGTDQVVQENPNQPDFSLSLKQQAREILAKEYGPRKPLDEQVETAFTGNQGKPRAGKQRGPREIPPNPNFTTAGFKT